MRHKLVGVMMICVWRKEEKKDWRSRKLLLLLSLFNLSTYRRSPRMKLVGIPRYTTYPWWKTVVMWLESSLIVPGSWQEGLSFQYILAPKLCIAWSYWGSRPIHALCYWTPDRIISWQCDHGTHWEHDRTRVLAMCGGSSECQCDAGEEVIKGGYK